MSIDFDRDKLQRSQPVPSGELDRRLLERAEKLTEGKKTFGSETADVKPVIMTGKEQDKMDNNTISEIRSRRPAVIISAAAALALVVGGATAALRYTGDDIETTPASQTETSAADFDVSGADTVTANALPKEWAEKYIKENERAFGYITIPNLEYDDGTRVIDFPVAIGDDNEYYMTHSFDKSENKTGCIFAKAGTEAGSDGSQPQIIELFGGEAYNQFGLSLEGSKWVIKLDEEADKTAPNFTSLQTYTVLGTLLQAPIIEFNTIWQEDSKYAVIGAFSVEGDALGIGNVDNISDWVKNIRDLSKFDVDIDCGADDNYLVLDLYAESRSVFRVFAKKLDDSDDIEAIKSSYRYKEGLDEAGNPVDNSYVDIELPVPKGINDMFIVAVYNGDDELSKDTFDDEDRKIFEDVYTSKDSSRELPDKYCFAVSGNGKQKFTVALIDPLSSDSTRNRVKYAVIDVDFTNGTYKVAGEPDFDAVKELFAAYSPAGSVGIEMPFDPGAEGDFRLDAYIDGGIVRTVEFTEEYIDTLHNIFPFPLHGEGKQTVTIYLKNRSLGQENYIKYAQYTVDFDNGAYQLKDGSEVNTAELLKISGRAE